MIPSRYLKIFTIPDRPRHLLLFSTRTTGLAVLAREEWEKVERGTAEPGLVAALGKLNFLVTDLHEERERVLRFAATINAHSSTVRVSVVLGMACNFACVYCYEGSQKGERAMADATADHLVEFLLSRLSAEKKGLIIDFYGGEPLLYSARIKDLVSRLGPLVRERGGRFEFTLVSNGSLLTPEVVGELVALGLSSAKITVDGPAANHDRFRPRRDGRGSWELIVANLKACCGLLPIFLSGNYTRDNFRLFPRLLDELAAAGVGPGRLAAVQFSPVIQINDRFANPDFSGGCRASNEPWLVEASLFIRGETLRRGYNFPKLRPATCMVDLDDNFTVHFDGKIYKCVSLVGHREFIAGDIRRGGARLPAGYRPDNWRKEEMCRRCDYLPLCFGGCRYLAYQRDGQVAGVDCQRTLLDSTLGEMLRQDLRYRHGPSRVMAVKPGGTRLA